MPQAFAQYSWLPGVVFALYFALLWLVVGRILSRMGGWWVLTRRYRTQSPFPANTQTFRSGTMRAGIGYHGFLKIGSDANGVYLGVLWPFRLSHPPLLVPWADVWVAEPIRSFFLTRQRLRFGPESVPLSLSPKLIATLVEMCPRA